MSRVELGDLVCDGISGWEGIAVGRYEYLNGCVRIGIGGKDKDGAPEEYVFDIQQVTVVRPGAFAPIREEGTTAERINAAAGGGPRDHRPPARR